jgi:hypothetical protein
LFDEDNLAHLAGLPILNLKGDFNPKGRIHASQVQLMAPSATPFEDIHALVFLTSLDAVESAQQGFWSAPRKLLVQDAQTRVVAQSANAVFQIRRVPEFAKRCRKRVLKRIPRL